MTRWNIMKKKFLIIVIILSLSSVLKGFDFGIKAGFNVFHISGFTFFSKDSGVLKGESFFKMTPDYSLGIYTSFELSNSLSFQSEILFSSKTLFFEFAEDTTASYKFQNLEVPILLKYTYNPRGSSLFPFIYGGIYYSAILDSGSEIINKGVPVIALDELRIIDNAGIVMGIGVDIKLKKSKLIMDLRYTFNSKDLISKTSTRNTKVIYLMMGFDVSGLWRD